MLRRVDHYISGLFLGYFFSALAALAILYVVVDSFSFIFSYDVSSLVFIRYYAYMLPSIMYRMFPVAAMAATVFTLGYLNRNSELVALFSFGTSLRRIITPLLGLVLLFSILGFTADNLIFSTLRKQRRQVFYKEIVKRPGQYATVRKNKIWYRSKNNLFYVKTLNTDKKKAQGLSLYSFGPDWQLLQMMTAKEVEILGEVWRLKSGTLTLFTEDSSFPLTQKFDRKSIVLGVMVDDLQGSVHPIKTLGVGELGKFIKKNKEAGLNTTPYEMDYHAKFSFAFAALVMSFLGIPFCVGNQRAGGGMRGLGITLGLAFVYWSFYSSSLALGRHGTLPPLLAAWLPNVSMVGLGAYFFSRLKK